MLVFVAEHCPYCCRPRNPQDIIRQPGGVRICVDCEQKHQAAIEALSTGKYNGECSECGQKSDQPNRLMEVHYENGKYRLMCMGCSARYVVKRLELYGGTEYARERGLS